MKAPFDRPYKFSVIFTREEQVKFAENIRYAVYHRNHKDGCRNKSVADYRGCGTNVSGDY